MIRIAIVGCGKIADQHIAAIHRVPNTQVTALCDREPLMAQQLGERFGVSNCYSNVGEMLIAARPDVVHVTTPPQSHFAIAKQCLEAGSHVYLEKPFTVNSDEARELIGDATQRKLNLTAGHNLQFTLEALEMRRLVAEGFLGGNPVHLESHFSYDLGDTSYVAPLLGNREHWVRKLPGQLLHNILSHGIAKLAEFLDDELEEVMASAHQSAKLAEMGGQEVLDELRVLLRDRHGTTAFFCFSTQLKPGLNRLRVCGPSNSIVVDNANGSVLRFRNRACKSYLTYFLPPLIEAREGVRNSFRNVANFVKGRLHQDSGMKELIERFYAAISSGGPPPIPYREIVLTAEIMDEVFTQIYSKHDSGSVELKKSSEALVQAL